MKYGLFLAIALFVPGPALATGGFDCRTTDGSGITVGGTLGRGAGNPLVGARLRLGDRTLSTSDEQPQIAVGQSWIDEREIRLDLIDPQGLRFEARLRARIAPRSGATGTLLRDGRSHPVRCTVE